MSNEIKPIDEIRGTLARMEGQIKSALPPHISPEKFTRVVMTALQMTPSLLACDRASLYGACMKCAQDGLLPDGREAALVKFKESVAYMPMVSGILKKVRNSGELSSITSQIVHKNDRFRYWVDSDGEHLEHEPLVFGDRGEEIGVYALAKTKDGGVYVEVMTLAQVDAIRNVSRSKDGPWSGPFASEMARKSAIRRLAKRLPMSTDIEQTIHRDDQFYDLKPSEVPAETAAVVEKKKRTTRLKDAVSKTAVTEAEILDDSSGDKLL